MKISEDEYVCLIDLAINPNYVGCSFGPNGVFINETPDQEWARNLVIEMRENPEMFVMPNVKLTSCQDVGQSG